MKAADYVLIPDIVNQNAKSGGKNIGGMLGGMIGGVAGAVAGGISLKSKTASVVLTLTDVRSTEQVSLAQGNAKKTDLGWGAGGGALLRRLCGSRRQQLRQHRDRPGRDGGLSGCLHQDGRRRAGHRRRTPRPTMCSRRSPWRRPARCAAGRARRARSCATWSLGAMLYPTGEKQGPFWKAVGRAGQRGLGGHRRCSSWRSKPADPEKAPRGRSCAGPFLLEWADASALRPGSHQDLQEWCPGPEGHRSGCRRRRLLRAARARTAPARPPLIGIVTSLVNKSAGKVSVFGHDIDSEHRSRQVLHRHRAAGNQLQHVRVARDHRGEPGGLLRRGARARARSAPRNT